MQVYCNETVSTVYALPLMQSITKYIVPSLLHLSALRIMMWGSKVKADLHFQYPAELSKPGLF